MSKVNYLLGRGERLTERVVVKRGFDKDKQEVYSLHEAKERLVPQIEEAVAHLESLPSETCPLNYGVLRWDLHPQYIAKSYFPQKLLRMYNLESVGSRNVVITPDKWTKKAPVAETPTTELFIAGRRDSFKELTTKIQNFSEDASEAVDFIRIEKMLVQDSADRLRLMPNSGEEYIEVALHLLSQEDESEIKQLFLNFVIDRGFLPAEELSFTTGLLWFLPMQNNEGDLHELAKFSLVRVIRPAPRLRGLRPFHRSMGVCLPCSLPNLPPVSYEPKVAILDGGISPSHPLGDWLRSYRELDETAADDPDGLLHGLAVTSAFLFGSILSGSEASRPYSLVDHLRVLDKNVDQEDPYELYRTLGLIEEVLLSRQYQFINLSLGPDLPIDDNEVHIWTSVLDNLLSDGNTLMTIAAGNNGEMDHATGNNRIQVPSDAVNALAVGAADLMNENWARSSYSAIGPGRSPGVVKPDLLAFGGGPQQYFHVLSEGVKPNLSPILGTSFASPYLLRSAVGIRAILGTDISPLAIKALLVHTALDSSHNVHEVGRGKIPEDIMEIISCADGVVRIVYQGELTPRKYIRAFIPIPEDGLKGRIRLKATFTYACETDPQDAACYTRAGLDIHFRPHAEKFKKEKQVHANTRSFFKKNPFATEEELRSDHGKWETVMHGAEGLQGTSLLKPHFDIHYNAREMGAATTTAQRIPYALIISIEAPKCVDIYNDILRAHSKILAPLQPRVELDVQT